MSKINLIFSVRRLASGGKTAIRCAYTLHNTLRLHQACVRCDHVAVPRTVEENEFQSMCNVSFRKMLFTEHSITYLT